MKSGKILCKLFNYIFRVIVCLQPTALSPEFHHPDAMFSCLGKSGTAMEDASSKTRRHTLGGPGGATGGGGSEPPSRIVSPVHHHYPQAARCFAQTPQKGGLWTAPAGPPPAPLKTQGSFVCVFFPKEGVGPVARYNTLGSFDGWKVSWEDDTTEASVARMPGSNAELPDVMTSAIDPLMFR